MEQQYETSELEHNSSNEPLAANAEFIGKKEFSIFPDVMVVCKTDVPGTVYFDFSPDGINWDSTFPPTGFQVSAGINEFHTGVKGPRYFRARLVNGDEPQTYLRMYVYYGNFKQGNLPVNSVIGQDADAIVVRNISENIALAEGKFSGYAIVSKLGKNTDVDTGTTPEDVWDGGNEYTGFPVGAPENLEAVSSNAGDTGTLSFLYLASDESEDYVFGQVTLNGTTPVDTGIEAWRVHTAWYDSGDDSTFNLGNIELRHITTTANVFIYIPTGTSQSNACVYTVPAGKVAYITNINAQIRRSSGTTIEGALWVRTAGSSPRLRQPWAAGQNDALHRDIVRFPLAAGTDISMRVLITSANNANVVAGMQIRLVSS